jgi:uncharacterized membrane protein
VAFANNAIPFVLFPLGERFVPSNIAAVLNATTPIWTLLLSMIFLGRKADGSTIPGVLLGFVGVVVVVFSQNTAGTQATPSEYLWGILFIAIASASYGVATVIAKAKLAGLDPIGLATTQLSLAGLMVLAAGLVCRGGDAGRGGEWAGLPDVLPAAGARFVDAGGLRHVPGADLGAVLGADRARAHYAHGLHRCGDRDRGAAADEPYSGDGCQTRAGHGKMSPAMLS